jgi:DNA-binding transcriptional regulator YiaG
VIESITAPEVKALAEKRRQGWSIRSLVTASNIPQHRLRRYLRIYEALGDEAFVPEKRQLSYTSNNNRKLRKLVERYSLTRPEIAELLNAPSNTVKNWLRSEGAKGFCPMPAYALELLQIKLREGKALEDMRRATD